MEIRELRVHNHRPVAVHRANPLAHCNVAPPNETRRMSAPYNKIFKLERDDEVLIVIPQGDASGFRYQDVHHESNMTLEVLDDPTLRHVIVDIGSEHLLGSIMISVVIKICRKIGTRGGKAALCNANPDMLEVLRTMNLERLWPYCPTREDALTSVRAG